MVEIQVFQAHFVNCDNLKNLVALIDNIISYGRGRVNPADYLTLTIQGNFDTWGKELPFLAPRIMRSIVKRFQKFGLLVVSSRDGVEWYTLDYTELMKQVAAYRAKHGAGEVSLMATEGGEAL